MRGLEILLGLIFHSVEGCQHSTVAILRGESAIASPGSRQDETGSTINLLLDAWRNSPSWKELEKILSTVEPGEDEELTARDLRDRLDETLMNSLSIKDAAPSAMFCPASPPDSLPVLLDHDSTSDAVGCTPRKDGGLSTNKTGASKSPSTDILHGGLSNILQDWSQLLDIYFSNTNCWIPIVLRNDAFRAAYTVSTESNSNDRGRLLRGEQACLLSILAYARYIQCITIGWNGPRQDIQDQFASLFAQASQLLANYESERDVGHIQAMLVLTLLHYAQGNLGQAWSFVGKAVYHAVELGLLKSGDTQSPPLDDRSKRVTLSCFVLETLLSARLHRRPYMRTSDVESVGLLDADGIEEWEPWRPTGLSSSPLYCNQSLPSHQPARILSTFNLLVQTCIILNEKLQCHNNDTDKRAPQEHPDICHLVQSQNRLNGLFAQSEEQDASPQALNLMLATLACFPQLVSTGTDDGHGGHSCSSNTTLDVHRIPTLVAEMVKRQGAVTLSPMSDVYLHIIESRNENSTSPVLREVFDSIKLVREIRAMYNQTWRNTSFNHGDPVQATVHNQGEYIAGPNAPLGVLGESPITQLGTRYQSSAKDRMETGTNSVGICGTRAPSAFHPLQLEGWVVLTILEVNRELTDIRLTCSRRAPPNNGNSTGDGDSWSSLLTPLPTTSSSDLFSSLVSLDNDDRCGLTVPIPSPCAEELSSTRNLLADQDKY